LESVEELAGASGTDVDEVAGASGTDVDELAGASGTDIEELAGGVFGLYCGDSVGLTPTLPVRFGDPGAVFGL
jgi:hypothetical protein